MTILAHPKRPRPLLEAHGLRAVRHGVDVLGGVTMRIFPGEVVAVLGGPHSGKSTLVRCLTGYRRASGGTLSLGGRDLGTRSWEEAQNALHAVIGRVSGHDRIPADTDLPAYVAEPFAAAGALPAAALAWARELLASVGLSALEILESGAADAAHRRLAALARSLALSPAVLIADEPTLDLDAGASHRVLSALLASADRPGRALVIATEDPEIAARADRVVTLEAGRAAVANRFMGAAVG